jgi:hypothetical protein
MIIVIISKKDTPEEIKEFRSINLCNVIYQMICNLMFG